LPRELAPAGDGREDPLPRSEPPRVQAALPSERAHPGTLGGGRQDDPARVRGALGRADSAGKGGAHSRCRPHAAVRATGGLRRLARRVSRLRIDPPQEGLMSTETRFAIKIDEMDWQVRSEFASTFRWEYEDGRESLLNLYEKGKTQQWNATSRIDWSQNLDPENPQELPD